MDFLRCLMTWLIGRCWWPRVVYLQMKKGVTFVNVGQSFFMSGIARPGFVGMDFAHGAYLSSWFQLTSNGEGVMLVRVDL